MLDTGYGFVNNLFAIKQKAKVGTDITGPTTAVGKRSADIRTLSGMKVHNGNLRRGVYIINGKKVVK